MNDDLPLYMARCSVNLSHTQDPIKGDGAYCCLLCPYPPISIFFLLCSHSVRWHPFNSSVFAQPFALSQGHFFLTSFTSRLPSLPPNERCCVSRTRNPTSDLRSRHNVTVVHASSLMAYMKWPRDNLWHRTHDLAQTSQEGLSIKLPQQQTDARLTWGINIFCCCAFVTMTNTTGNMKTAASPSAAWCECSILTKMSDLTTSYRYQRNVKY